MDTQHLRLEQIERAISQAVVPLRPASGWLHVIRSALGITTRQLAAQLGMGQSSLVALEKSESEDRITLQSLRKVADALDCDLSYVLIPRTPFTERIENRAEQIANERLGRVLHSMRLEDQAPTSQVDKQEVEKLKLKLLDSSWRQLWK